MIHRRQSLRYARNGRAVSVATKKTSTARLALVPPQPEARSEEEHKRAVHASLDADERLVAEIIRRPALLSLALLRDPELIVRAVRMLPALRQQLVASLQALDTRGRTGTRGHSVETRMAIQLLDKQLIAEDPQYAKDGARHRAIAERMTAWGIFGVVKQGGVRDILEGRKRPRKR